MLKYLSTKILCNFAGNKKHIVKMRIIDYKNVDIQIDSKIILEDVTFTLDSGEFAYIVGAVGSGKSTLIKTIYGEVDIHAGDARLFGEYDLRKLKRRKLPALRKRLGIVFQDFQLLTDRNVRDNLDFVLRSTGWKKKEEREKRIAEVLQLVELEQKGYRMPHELSGGEQQRVVIARAILNRPALLLADEPTGNLDSDNGNKIMELLHRICKEDSTAVVMITHNEQWLKSYPARQFRCENRKLIEQKEEKVEAPATPVAETPATPVAVAPATPVAETPATPVAVAPTAPVVEAPATPTYTTTAHVGVTYVSVSQPEDANSQK